MEAAPFPIGGEGKAAVQWASGCDHILRITAGRVLFRQSLLPFRAFCWRDPFADGATAQPVAAQPDTLLHKFGFSRPRSSRSKEAETPKRWSQLQWRLHRQRPPQCSSRIQPAGPELSPASALSRVPQGRSRPEQHILNAARAKTASGAQWARPATGRKWLFAGAAIWATPANSNGAWASPIERRSGVGGPAERQCSLQQPRACPAGDAHTAVVPTARERSASRARPAFSPP